MKNIAAKHRKIAERFIEPLKNNKEIKGIVFLGSIARNFGDEYSDIDIAVFSHHHLSNLHKGEKWLEGFDFDVFQINLNDGYHTWDDAQKEAYAEGILAYDRENIVQNFLSQALHYSDNERLGRLVKYLIELSWNGWSYSPVRNTVWKGYKWAWPCDLWVLRGSLDNAAYTLHYSQDLLINLLYAINRKWVPDAKWKFIKSYKLSWLPTNFESTMSIIRRGPIITEKDYYDKAEHFQRLIDECYEKVIWELPDDVYRYYVEVLGEY